MSWRADLLHQLDHLKSQKCLAQQAKVNFPVENGHSINVHGSFPDLQQGRPLQNKWRFINQLLIRIMLEESFFYAVCLIGKYQFLQQVSE